MKAETYWGIGLVLFLAVAPWALAQDAAQACPDVSPNTLGCELVAWSHLQEPVPLPDSQSQPDPTPGQPPDSQTQPQASRQRITGIIVRQGEKFVLKAGDNTTYQLDDQDRAKRYEDKRVMVVGRLDADNHTFHIESIELVS
jgi:Protein of unknown function (DUF5818)